MKEAPESAGRAVATLFAGSVFLSAFLLFEVQPVVGKFILPWFGSTPAVWTTCMLFFQMLLLGGYAYAHGLVRFGTPRVQAAVHGALLVAATLVLPVTPRLVGDGGAGEGDPTGRILLVLALSVGLPYLALSATGPLLLAWRARLLPDRPAYRLYALSNAGSLLALLSYPFAFEPVLGLTEQTSLWSVGFGAFAVLGLACALCSLRRETAPSAPSASREVVEGVERPPSIGDLALWVGLAACGSGLLLATTNQLCLDVAVVPFLWVLPLSLYLVTFILCFDHPRWYHRGLFVTLLPMAGAAACYLLGVGVNLDLTVQILGYSFVLFVGCMCCHGELVRARPAPRHLTLFFLTVSLGGAVGGLCVAVVAPAVFSAYLEFPVSVAGAVLLTVIATWRCGVLGRPAVYWATGAALALAAWLGWLGLENDDAIVARDRNFYGVLTVKRYVDEDGAPRRTTLLHGRIHHGNQNGRDPAWPNSYYGPLSGVGLALRHHPARAERGLRLGVVGLGAGTLAAYASAEIDPFPADGGTGVEDDELVRRVGPRAGGHRDTVCYYEINPLVIDWARRWFSYLDDAEDRGAEVTVTAGDARLAMQRQLDRGEPQAFDVLAIDAFSGDAIPIHLLTAECVKVYARHLAEGGVLAVHVSNRFIDLVPVVHEHAVALGMACVVVEDASRDSLDNEASTWVLVTDHAALLASAELRERGEVLAAEAATGPLWSDDYSSVATLLK